MNRAATAAVVVAVIAAAAGSLWMLGSAPTPASPPADAPSPAPRLKIPRRRHDVAAPAAAIPVAPPPPAPPSSPGRLVVRVTNGATHAPIAGADVLAADARDVERTATTDAAGVARFDALAPPSAELLVEATGFVRKLVDDAEIESDATKEQAVELRPGVAAAGVVLDDAGRPLAGAAAMATEDRDDWDDDSITPLAETTSAADGTFRLASLPADRPSFLHFTAKDFAVLTIEWNPASGGRVTARLVRRGTLRGVVRDRTGRAVGGAEVVADSETDDRHETAKTGVDGRFAIEGLAVGGAWHVRATKTGFVESAAARFVVGGESRDVVLRSLPQIDVLILDPNGRPVDEAEVSWGAGERRTSCVAGRATIVVDAPGTYRFDVDAPRFVARSETAAVAGDEVKTVTVRLEAGASLTGVVIDDVDAPVAGAQIECSYGGSVDRPYATRTATSDAAGRFRVEGLAAGGYSMRAQADGHASTAIDADAPSDGLRVVLRRLARLAFALRVPSGATPPSEVTLHVEERRETSVDPHSANFGASSESIRWVVDHAVKWTDSAPTVETRAGRLRVVFSADGFIPVSRDVDIAAGQEVPLGEIVLDPGLLFAGVVVDDLGVPIRDATVQIDAKCDADSGRLGIVERKTDADGRFVLSGIARVAQLADVRAFAAEHEPTFLADVPLAGEPPRIVLRRNGRLTFRVRIAPGDPPPETIQVFFTDFHIDVPRLGEVTTSLPPGRRVVVVRATGYAPARREFVVEPAGETRIEDVVLDRGLSLSGRLLDAHGRPVADARVWFVREPGEGESATIDAEGNIAIEHLVAGEISVRYGADGYAWDVAKCVVRRDSEPVSLTLHRGGLVHGTVHDTSGKCPDDVGVVLRRKTGEWDLGWRGIDQTGEFSVRLPPGAWTFVLVRDDQTLASRDVDVADDGDVTADFTVTR